MNLDHLRSLFAEIGVTKLYAKPLSENDNSKNQIYFAGAIELLNVLPSKEILAAEAGKKGPTFKAAMDFHWLLENRQLARAPGAQLIFYPQYPEVRFSGFLRGCPSGPTTLMADRERAKGFPPEVARQLKGRVLFLGTTESAQVIGYVAAGNSLIAQEFNAKTFPTAFVVFRQIPVPDVLDASASRNKLVTELRRIRDLGWIDSKQLRADGTIQPCNAPQCGGFTLEAELGIPKNSASEPDFLGWEIKQHTVSNFNRSESGTAITLMTPEPTGGFYKSQGVEAFVRKFGYADKRGRADRLNFGGVHKSGMRHDLTGLRLTLIGYDSVHSQIIDANGSIALVSENDEIAAQWSFAGVFSHWSRKHSLAAYVPSMRRTEPFRQYSYGGRIRLAQRTNPLLLLAALASGKIFYDPGIKVENASKIPVIKRRSQFRIASKDISAIYEAVERVEL